MSKGIIHSKYFYFFKIYNFINTMNIIKYLLKYSKKKLILKNRNVFSK